jgi:hypothetical protein
VIEGMSQETFDENREAILVGIRALLENPKSRQRNRRLRIQEYGTGELLGEVFGTHHGPVVVYRGNGGTAADGRFDAFRQGRGRSELVVAPLTAGDDDFFGLIFSRAHSAYRLTGDDLVRALAEGRRKITVGAPQ